jgi:hypothetical protein
LEELVGAKGFEPSTSWSRTRRASQAALRPDTLRLLPEDEAKFNTIGDSQRIVPGRRCVAKQSNHAPRPNQLLRCRRHRSRRGMCLSKKLQCQKTAAPRNGLRVKLEAIPQREFHHPRPRKRVRIAAETSRRVDRWEYIRGVESHRIRDVVHVPGERKRLAFRQVPGFADCHINPEIPGATQIVTVAGFSGKRKAPGVSDEIRASC